MDEQVVWKGSSSHWLNFHIYLFSMLSFFLLVFGLWKIWPTLQKNSPVLLWGGIGISLTPLIIFAYRWIRLKLIIFEVTTERIKIISGIFNRKTITIELYRVKDYVLGEPFFMRLAGLGNILLTTSDPDTPKIVLQAIVHPGPLMDKIRTHVEACRGAKGVRQLDVDQLDNIQ